MGVESAITFVVYPPPEDVEPTKPSADLTFTLDTSESMAGTLIKEAKDAVQASLKDLQDKGALPKTVHIMVFNTDTAVRTFTNATAETICAYVASINTGGSTNFVKMFQAIELALLRSGKTEFKIVLNSDGKHEPGNRIAAYHQREASQR